MNKRKFLKTMAAAGVAVGISPLALAEEYSAEKHILNTLKRMPIGGTITVIKLSETDWRLIGDIPDIK